MDKQTQTTFAKSWIKGAVKFQAWATGLRRAAAAGQLLAAPLLSAHPISLISCQALVQSGLQRCHFVAHRAAGIRWPLRGESG